MCPRHWYMVPPSLRTQVWRTYRPGQEVSKTPTQEYIDAARTAINYVAQLEDKPALPETADIIKTLEKMIAKSKGDSNA